MTAPGGTLTQRLQLLVDATTERAEARFRALGGAARESGQDADRSASSVVQAADRVASAREREQVAGSNLRVAEARLTELRESGRAKASQLVAAEERVATAQRQVQMAVSGHRRALEDQTAVQGRATAEAGRTTGATDRLASATRGLLGEVVGLVAGGGLVAFLQSAGQGFATASRDAGQLARSMNATVEQAGSFMGLVGSLGLELNDLLEIQAEFAQKVQDNGAALDAMGAEVDRNRDGTVNWANTLVDFLENLQNVEDATERNRLGFQFLGEEGFKQLSRLVNSGMGVREALAAIGTPFTEADIAAAAEYDAQMFQLSLTGQALQRDLGRALLPVLAGIAEGFGDVMAVVTAIPGPIAVATAAALAMGLTGFSPAALAGGRLAAASTAVAAQVTLARAAMLQAAAAGGNLGLATAAATAGMSTARAAGGRLLGLVGGPFGAAMIAGGTALHFASEGASELDRRAREAAEGLGDLSRTRVGPVLQRTADELEESAGWWERSAAYVRGYQQDLTGWERTVAGALEPFQRLTAGFIDNETTARGFEAAIQQAREELGEFGAQSANADQQLQGLQDLVAQGITSGAQFADAVGRAAQAQEAQTRTSDTAEAAIAAYNATTRDAVNTALEFMNAQLASADAGFAFLDAVDAARAATDDAATSVDEVAQAHVRLQQAALQAGSAAADAAVENARSSGVVLTAAEEAATRADAMLGELRARLATPGLTDRARADLQGMVDKLQEARDRGDVKATLRLTGVAETKGQLDTTTKDRNTAVKVESRGGPAVDAYLDRLAADRLALIRVESRNGPAARDYINSVAGQERLALIRVESRNGPAARDYINSVAGQDRLALIRVESRGGPAVDAYLDSLAGQRRTAYIDAARAPGAPGLPGPTGAPAGLGGMFGSPGVTVQSMTVQVAADAGGRLTSQSLAAAGRQVVAQLAAYERHNGAGWRR